MVTTSSENAISVDGLSKAYRVGSKVGTPDTLVGWLQGALRSPFKNWRYLRSLTDVRRMDDQHRIWALDDVSFDIAKGEVVGIVGRNGSGKSTLLKILSRITDPTRGSATIRGRVSSLLEVGTGFHPELTGRENIYMNGTLLGMTKREIDVRFDEIVDFSGVEKFLDTPIKRFSSGMQVRLAFSVAAHLQPEILIIDEVLAVGDAEFQRRCIGKMQDVASSGRTVLFVSHNMSAVGQLCTSGILLSGGRIVTTGELSQVVQAYMDDLFQTESTAEDENYRVCIHTAIDGDHDARIWEYGSELTVSVHIESQQELRHPAVDITLNSSAGRMVLAKSDQHMHDVSSEAARRWCFDFQLKNTGFVSDYMSLDVGLRYRSSTRYLGQWRSLAAIALGKLPEGYSCGRDCPIAVPCEVHLGRKAA